MSDHGDHPHPRIDLTDLYAFPDLRDSSKSILVLNLNPDAPKQANSFSSDATHEIKIDTNGDSTAEIACRITFSPVRNGTDSGHQTGTQTATVRYVQGDAAASMGADGEVIFQDVPVSYNPEAQVATSGDWAFFAGIRSDPFFLDAEGFGHFLDEFEDSTWFTGSDTFAEQNVFSVVLEVPNSIFGSNSTVGVWGCIVLPIDDGRLEQVERVGNPFTNVVFNRKNPDEQDRYNRAEPTQDRELFLPKFAAVLQAAGGYSPDEATRVAETLLPDIMAYDYSRPDGSGGRRLSDDATDSFLALLTNGTVTTDRVKPHTDLLAEFPYVGSPHTP